MPNKCTDLRPINMLLLSLNDPGVLIYFPAQDGSKLEDGDHPAEMDGINSILFWVLLCLPYLDLCCQPQPFCCFIRKPTRRKRARPPTKPSEEQQQRADQKMEKTSQKKQVSCGAISSCEKFQIEAAKWKQFLEKIIKLLQQMPPPLHLMLSKITGARAALFITAIFVRDI